MLTNLHLSNYNYVKYILKGWAFDKIFEAASRQQLKKKVCENCKPTKKQDER